MEARTVTSILERVRALVSEETGIALVYIKADTKVSSLVSDSLELASVVVQIEDEFGIEIDGIGWRNSVGDVVKIIEAKK